MAKAKLEINQYEFSHLRLNGYRLMARLAVVCHHDGDPLPTQSFIIQDDTALEVNGQAYDRDQLVDWAHNSGKAVVKVTQDPKRSGYCTKLEFTPLNDP